MTIKIKNGDEVFVRMPKSKRGYLCKVIAVFSSGQVGLMSCSRDHGGITVDGRRIVPNSVKFCGRLVHLYQR